MRTKKRIQSPLFMSILLGSGTAYLISVLGSAIVAKLIDGETIPEDSMKYAVMLLTMLSAIAATVLGLRNAENRKVWICMGIAAGYMLLLIASNIILFEGTFAGVLPSALICLGSTMCVFLLNMNHKKNNKRKWGGKYR